MLLQTSITLMITAAVVSSLCVFRMRPIGRWSGVAGIPLDERHDRNAGFESRQAERQLREEQQGDERPS